MGLEIVILIFLGYITMLTFLIIAVLNKNNENVRKHKEKYPKGGYLEDISEGIENG